MHTSLEGHWVGSLQTSSNWHRPPVRPSGQLHMYEPGTSTQVAPAPQGTEIT